MVATILFVLIEVSQTPIGILPNIVYLVVENTNHTTRMVANKTQHCVFLQHEKVDCCPVSRIIYTPHKCICIYFWMVNILSVSSHHIPTPPGAHVTPWLILFLSTVHDASLLLYRYANTPLSHSPISTISN